MTKHEQWRYGFAVLSGLVLVSFLYVAAYLFLVEPTPVLRETDGDESLSALAEADYAFGGVAAQYAFAPLERLDRRCFPDRWQFNVEIMPGMEAE